MPTEGWFKMFRPLFRHPLFGDPACRGYAFADLIGMAEHDTIRRGVRSEVVELQRGELLASVRFLADRWKWGRSKVERFLTRLESERMIGTVRETPVGTVYRIVNYSVYQGKLDSERDTKRDTERDSGGTAAGQIKEEKNPPTPTPDPRELSIEERAKLTMWIDFDKRIESQPANEQSKAQALVRGIIDGDTATAWTTPTGDRVPWEERPRLFRLALDERIANGGKLFNVLRQVIIPREFDPFKQTKSTDERPRRQQGDQTSPPPRLAPASEVDKLKSDHPELHATVLAEFEACSWWATAGALFQQSQIISTMKERLRGVA